MLYNSYCKELENREKPLFFFYFIYYRKGLLLITAKQKRFCDEYLVDCNATQAAIRAGYSKKSAGRNADRLMKNDEIKNYIENQLKELHKSTIADAQEVIEYLTSVMRGECKEEVLRLSGDGIQTIDNIEVSAKERIKAAELIGKRYGIFNDKVSLEIEPVVIIDNVPEGDKNE